MTLPTLFPAAVRRRLTCIPILLSLFLLIPACSRTDPMSPDDKIEAYVDYAAAVKRLPSMDAPQVQREFGSPDDVERLTSGRVIWRYKRRFCETDARCVYKRVSLTFDERKFVSIETR